MKKLNNLLLFIFLSIQGLVASVPIDSTSVTQNSLNPDQWEQIVDYTNTEVTRFYIEFLIKNGDLEESDVKEFDNKLKVSIYNNEITDPTKFEKLNSLLESKFSKTLNNVSIPINNLKSLNDKYLKNLFKAIETILDSVRAPEVYNNNDFNALHTKVDRHVETLNFSKANNGTNDLDEEILNKSWYEKDSFPFVFLILSIVFCLFSVGLILFRNPKDNNSQSISTNPKTDNIQVISNINPSRKKFNDEEVVSNNRTIEKLKTQLINLEEEFRKYKLANGPKSSISDKSKEKKKLDNPSILSSFEVNNVLFAGKPSAEKILKEISTQSDPQQTIFKLNILPNNNELAEFEVFHVSDFMTRNITNAPDDYLYRVCNHENTNQEFRKEILTVKKGTANLIDGEWTVKEENKATIKFQ